MRKSIIATFIATAFLSLNAGASDLLQVYKEALANDAQYSAARAAKMAGAERSVQGRSALLPRIGLSGGVSKTHSEFDPDIGNTIKSNSTGNSVTLSLSQPLFNLGTWESYEQSKLAVVASEIQFAQAQQDLMLRVSQAYFDVLAAENTLQTLQAQKVATAEQLASAKRNFEVGTQTITDTHEAQSAFDLVTAQVLAGEGDLEVKRAALRQIIGKDAGNLSRLKDGVQLSSPVPAQINEWVATAEKQNFAVTSSQVSLEIAQREIKKSRSGHLPTIDFSASTGRSSGSSAAAIQSGVSKPTTVGVSVNIPLFSGFGTDSRVRETIALEDKARNDLESARRAAAQNARQAYIGVVSGLSQIKAFEAAEISSQSALDSTKLGYQVGVRINIDVLNAQQKLSNTRQSLAKARYDNIINGLRLKAAAGTLKEADLAEVNTLLVQ
ncbi:TolC family outer membrane protein [Undibacterium sp. LX40W]|uniref:TolC family outer membrane protein n=1 Tax=Undibacterium nitidum TaxID=2762298 RepID=A0A923KPQ7_9BURK|nr:MULTISPECIES: TolC family outer membrane protein [Undibacterium]MBC3882078.1 TolC family outer membrane protein [Undibacterium nitidum]MBC3892359.1 TolC family outer membrane protein [Undibacterium sp. LX40W]